MSYHVSLDGLLETHEDEAICPLGIPRERHHASVRDLLLHQQRELREALAAHPEDEHLRRLRLAQALLPQVHTQRARAFLLDLLLRFARAQHPRARGFERYRMDVLQGQWDEKSLEELTELIDRLRQTLALSGGERFWRREVERLEKACTLRELPSREALETTKTELQRARQELETCENQERERLEELTSTPLAQQRPRVAEEHLRVAPGTPAPSPEALEAAAQRLVALLSDTSGRFHAPARHVSLEEFREGYQEACAREGFFTFAPLPQDAVCRELHELFPPREGFRLLASGAEMNVYLHEPLGVVFKVPHRESTLDPQGSGDLETCALSLAVTRELHDALQEDMPLLREALEEAGGSPAHISYLFTHFLEVSDAWGQRVPLVVQPFLREEEYLPVAPLRLAGRAYVGVLQDWGLSDLQEGNVRVHKGTGELVLFDCLYREPQELREVLSLQVAPGR